MEYKDQIKTGMWQEKRLRVFERDGFKCTCCGSENDLQTHHLYYIKGRKIYEYELESLKTVCGECHEKLTFEMPKLSGLIAWKILSGQLDQFDTI